MKKIKDIESLSSNNLSLISILIEACKNNYDLPFAADTLILLELIKENELKILDFLADVK